MQLGFEFADKVDSRGVGPRWESFQGNESVRRTSLVGACLVGDVTLKALAILDGIHKAIDHVSRVCRVRVQSPNPIQV